MLSFSRSDLNWRTAGLGTLLVATTVAFAAALGTPGVAGAFGIFVALAGSAISKRDYLSWLLLGTVGTIVTFVGFLSAGKTLSSVLLLSGVTWGAQIVASAFARLRMPVVLLAVWSVVALSMGSVEEALWAVAWFAGGFGAAAFLNGLRFVAPGPDVPQDPNRLAPDVFLHSAIKTLAVAVSVALGFVLFPASPYWLPLTVMIVAQLDGRRTLARARDRSLGTALGAGVGSLILAVVGTGGRWPLAVATIVLVFLEFLFLEANYVLFALFLTAFIVTGLGMVGANGTGLGSVRLGATVVGSLISIGVVFLSRRLSVEAASA